MRLRTPLALVGLVPLFALVGCATQDAPNGTTAPGPSSTTQVSTSAGDAGATSSTAANPDASATPGASVAATPAAMPECGAFISPQFAAPDGWQQRKQEPLRGEYKLLGAIKASGEEDTGVRVPVSRGQSCAFWGPNQTNAITFDYVEGPTDDVTAWLKSSEFTAAEVPAGTYYDYVLDSPNIDHFVNPFVLVGDGWFVRGEATSLQPGLVRTAFADGPQ